VNVLDIFSSALSIFTEPALFGAMLIGLTMGMVFGAIPGLSGKMGLLLLLPLLFGMDPEVGIVLLLSMHAVVHTGGSIPSILVGVPGGAPEAATVIDGFAMAKKGEAAEALGASMAASGVGGALGAVSYFVLLPAFAIIGRVFGAPEYLLLALLGLCGVATLSQGSILKGFAMAALGLLAGAVGTDYATGTPRFVFGRLELWDGIDVLIVITGLFAVPELLDLARKKRLLPDAGEAAARCTYRALFRGMAATWTHRWLTIRTTIIGIIIGMMPGLGAEVASWLAYGHAVQTGKDRTRFGQGAIEGVIAPETANNSKEGGSLLPTVTFGIPGSSTMALMIAGFAILGLPLGPTFLQGHGKIAALIGWSVLWSNLAAVLAFVAVLPLVGRIVYLRIDYMAPIVLAISVTGTVIDQHGWVPMLLLLGVSVIGTFLIRADWPRAPFLLAFIMGHLAEINLIKATEVYSWDAFARWPSWLLAAILVYLIVRGVRAHKGQPSELFSRADFTIAAALLIAFAAAGVTSLGFRFEARLLPLGAAIIGGVTTVAILATRWRGGRAEEGIALPPVPWRLLANFALLLLLVPEIGIFWAVTLYAAIHGLLELRGGWRPALLVAAITAGSIWLLFGVWLRLPLF
jgi:TctA family transporter